MTYNEVVTKWRSKKLKTVFDYTTNLIKFCIEFTCNSNNVENGSLNYHTTKEVYEDAPLSMTGANPRDLFEARNTKFAFGYLFKCLENNEQISLDMIKHVHKLVTYGTYDEVRWEKGERPGEFKKGDYVVGLTDEGSFADEVIDDLSELLNEVNEAVSENRDALTIAAYFHLRFEQIHPFADGNGRVGRLLLCYFLMLNNLPPVNIYYEDRDTYYLALEVFDRKGEIKGFIEFLKEQTIKTWTIRKPKYTLEQITRARELAPSAYANLSDDELWELVGNYITKG